MTPNFALRIISISSFLICFSVFIFKDFYLKEILYDIDLKTKKEIGYFIYICAVCGVNISILLFFASTLIEKSARKMLKATTLIFSIMAITLTIILFISAVRIPHFILFMVFIFSIFSYAISHKKNG